MITNTILGTNNLNKVEFFYNTLLALFGAKQVIKNLRSVLWKSDDNSVGLAVCTHHNELPATHGNGSIYS